MDRHFPTCCVLHSLHRKNIRSIALTGRGVVTEGTHTHTHTHTQERTHIHTHAHTHKLCVKGKGNYGKLIKGN